MAIVQLTDAGAALLAANTGPITLSTYKLGSAVNYVPEPTDTNIHGTLVLQGTPSVPVAMSANVVKYGVYLDYGTGPYAFGELGLFTSDGTLFALVAWNELINKLPVTANSVGNSIRIDVYLSVVGQNYDMWLDLASSSNTFRMAILGSVDLLPQSPNATPNAYVISGLSQFQSTFIAYTDRAGLWNFDAYDFAAQHTATITGSTGQSITIALTDYAPDMNPNYLGQVIVEFSTGQLYSTCRYVESAITVGDHVTFGFSTPIMIQPVVGDQIIVWVRRIATTEIPLPIANHNSLGGIIVGQSLTVDGTGLLDVDYTAIPFPVKSVNGKTGIVVLTAADITGFATVATSGSYNDLTNKPTPYSLPIATTSILGGVKAPSSGRITIAGDGTIDLGSTLVTSVAGKTGAVVLAYTDINGLATVAHSGDYNDLINKPTIPSPYTLPIATASVLGGVKIGSGLSIDGTGLLSTTGGYTLPVATASVLGGVKQGSNVTIAGDGTISVAAPYSLPIATTSILGGVKQGTNITISADGTISASVTPYTLPVATTTVLGGVKQGANVAIAGDGTLSVAAPYVLPVATTTVLGGVKQGTNITIAGDGTISAAASPYTLPVATTTVLGGVKQGANVTIAGDGTLSVSAPYVLPTASSSVLGGVKVGAGLGIDGSGVLFVAAGNGVTSFNTRTGDVSLIPTDITSASGALLSDVSAAKYYDVQGGSAGTLTASQLVCQHVCVRALNFNANFSGSNGFAGTAPTGSVTFNVNKIHSGSTTLIGTIVFAASSQTSTFTTTGGVAQTTVAGDVIQIVAPASPDTTLANVSVTLLSLAT